MFSEKNALQTTMAKTTKATTGATFRVRVQLGANKNEIMQVHEDALRIRISAPPVKGKANRKKWGQRLLLLSD